MTASSTSEASGALGRRFAALLLEGATVLLERGEGYDPDTVLESIAPVTGGGLVFPHGAPYCDSLYHAGSEVTRGVKYVLRTDIF